MSSSSIAWRRRPPTDIDENVYNLVEQISGALRAHSAAHAV
jgi:hypothetical protein